MEKNRFIQYVVPSILSNFGTSCYILIDTIFLTRISENALAALNIILPIYELPMAIGSLFGIGASTLYAIHKARGERNRGSEYFTVSVIAGMVISVLLAVVILMFNSRLTVMLGADAETHRLATDYLRGYIVFMPAMVLNFIITNFIRNDGDPRLASTASIMGSVFNLIFDVLFIVVLDLGMYGAALASGASPLFSLLVSSIHFFKKRNGFSFVKAENAVKKTMETIKLGFSAFLSVMAASLVTLAFNKQLLALGGNTAVTAYGIMVNLSVLVNCIVNGVTQGVQPLFSECYGKGDTDGLKQYQKKTVYWIIGSFIFSFGLTVLFPNQIIGIFNPENSIDLMNITRVGMIIYFSGFLFTGLTRYLSTYFVSVNDALPASVISIMSSGLIITPIVLLLPGLFGLKGVWMSYPVSEALISLTGFILIKKQKTM